MATPGYTTKKKDSYTVDEKILEEFKKIAKKIGINKSAWIQSRMEEFVRQNS